jgi:hypothetical protein
MQAAGTSTAAARIIDFQKNKMVAGDSLHDQPVQQGPKPMAREIAVSRSSYSPVAGGMVRLFVPV